MDTIDNFRTSLGATSWNHQVVFFGYHDPYYESNSFDIMSSKFILPFVLKSGDSENDQPNKNGPNASL